MRFVRELHRRAGDAAEDEGDVAGVPSRIPSCEAVPGDGVKAAVEAGEGLSMISSLR